MGGHEKPYRPKRRGKTVPGLAPPFPKGGNSTGEQKVLGCEEVGGWEKKVPHRGEKPVRAYKVIVGEKKPNPCEALNRGKIKTEKEMVGGKERKRWLDAPGEKSSQNPGEACGGVKRKINFSAVQIRNAK